MRSIPILCFGLLLLSGCAADSSPEPEDTPPAPAPTSSVPKQDTKIPGEVSFGKTRARLVPAAAALQNPKVVKVASGLKTEGGVTSQGLFGVSSDVMMTMLQSQIRLQRELNGGRNPTFDEFAQSLRQANIGFAPLPRWQMIGYDESTGELSLLEDKGDKIRRYRAKNIPLDDDDKPYDTEPAGN